MNTPRRPDLGKEGAHGWCSHRKGFSMVRLHDSAQVFPFKAHYSLHSLFPPRPLLWKSQHVPHLQAKTLGSPQSSFVCPLVTSHRLSLALACGVWGGSSQHGELRRDGPWLACSQVTSPEGDEAESLCGAVSYSDKSRRWSCPGTRLFSRLIYMMGTGSDVHCRTCEDVRSWS